MVARARKHNEDFDCYKQDLRKEDILLKWRLNGFVTWGHNKGSNKGWKSKQKKLIKLQKAKAKQ